ncbi:MAG TPA: tetratricopeptide repeat protein [Bacteroidota bacterium]|nr:tetratricopeptide repeat protein [Bacteroidota bacterium]
MKGQLIAVMVIVAAQCAAAQSIRSLVNGGNDLYHDKKYSDAEVNYRKALEKEKGLIQGHFNLGNALAKQGKNDEAAKEFAMAAEKAEHRETKESAYYNIGNTQMAAQQYGDAVRSYVEALKIDPKDEEAKYNLSYALEKIREQQQQQKQNQKQQDKNDKNKNKQQNNPQDQNQSKNQDKKPDDQKQQPKDQQANRQQEKRMSKSDAERILEVLKNNEKDVQKKLHTRPAERPTTDKDW